MPNDPTFASFEIELNLLVESFGKHLVEVRQPGCAEVRLRDDFLNPFFSAPGWDMETAPASSTRNARWKTESKDFVYLARTF